MFDKYLIVDGSLRNVDKGGSATGFAVDTRIAYYRGLGLSMVDVALSVDGETIPPRELTFTVHGNDYRADQMGEVMDDRWGFTEVATLTVHRDGGLPPGSHTVQLTESLRISYAPAPVQTSDTKTLTVS